MNTDNTTLSLKEMVWKQLIDYIESEDLFFPFKIRQKISDEAHQILDEFVELMLERKMLVEFRRKNIFNRIALWIFKRKIKDHEKKDELTQIYVKGPNWDVYKDQTYVEVAGIDEESNQEIIH